jgi:hypothetical protein
VPPASETVAAPTPSPPHGQHTWKNVWLIRSDLILGWERLGSNCGSQLRLQSQMHGCCCIWKRTPLPGRDDQTLSSLSNPSRFSFCCGNLSCVGFSAPEAATDTEIARKGSDQRHAPKTGNLGKESPSGTPAAINELTTSLQDAPARSSHAKPACSPLKV